MKKQYISPTVCVFSFHAELALAMSMVIDNSKQSEQWTQQKGWYEEDWTSMTDGGEEEQGYW